MMAYTEVDQIKDAVNVLCERINADLRDRRQPQEFREWLARDRGHLIAWRKTLVQQALDGINKGATQADQQHRVRASATKADLRKIIAALRRAKILTAKLPDLIQPSFSGLDRMISAADAWSRMPSGPGHRASHRQQEAVAWAEFLITVTDEFPLKTTRGGQWHRLSAILFGDRNADLYRHMLRHKKHPRSIRHEPE